MTKALTFLLVALAALLALTGFAATSGGLVTHDARAAEGRPSIACTSHDLETASTDSPAAVADQDDEDEDDDVDTDARPPCHRAAAPRRDPRHGCAGLLMSGRGLRPSGGHARTEDRPPRS